MTPFQVAENCHSLPRTWVADDEALIINADSQGSQEDGDGSFLKKSTQNWAKRVDADQRPECQMTKPKIQMNVKAQMTKQK